MSHKHTLSRMPAYATPQLLPYELLDRMKDSVNCDVCGRRCFADTRKRTIITLIRSLAHTSHTSTH